MTAKLAGTASRSLAGSATSALCQTMSDSLSDCLKALENL